MTTRQFLKFFVFIGVAIAIAVALVALDWATHHPENKEWAAGFLLIIPAVVLYLYRILACQDCGYRFGNNILDFAFPEVARLREFGHCPECGADLDSHVRHLRRRTVEHLTGTAIGGPVRPTASKESGRIDPTPTFELVRDEAEQPTGIAVGGPMRPTTSEASDGCDPTPTFELVGGGFAVVGYSVTWFQFAVMLLLAAWIFYPSKDTADLKLRVQMAYPTQTLFLLKSGSTYSYYSGESHTDDHRIYLLLPSFKDVEIRKRDANAPVLSPPDYGYSIYLALGFAYAFLWPLARRFLGDGRFAK